MSIAPQTIQIFLPGGDPRGIRIAEITTRIVQVIEVPRSLLAEFLRMPESGQVALYFLLRVSEDGSEQRVYVGQTGDLRTRLAAHNKERDFWQRALVLVSKTNSLTQTHGLFLEWHCLNAIKRAARFSCENGNNGSEPHTPAPLKADCLEVFETGRILLATLGYSIFDPVRVQSATRFADELFLLTASGVNGRGDYTPEGFVVLKGSVGRKENVPSIRGTGDERLRVRLVETKVMREEGDTVVFEKDHLFRTPSGAAVALLGRTSNGWIEWKTNDGKTLKEVKRPTTVDTR